MDSYLVQDLFGGMLKCLQTVYSGMLYNLVVGFHCSDLQIGLPSRKDQVPFINTDQSLSENAKMKHEQSLHRKRQRDGHCGAQTNAVWLSNIVLCGVH